MTNCHTEIVNCKVLGDKIGDHQAIKIELDFKVSKADKFKKVLIRDHCKKNLTNLKISLSKLTDFFQITNCKNVDLAAYLLNNYIANAYENCCPTKVIKCHGHYLYSPSKELLDNIKTKKKLFCKFKKAKRNDQNSEKCKKLWDEYRSVTKISRRYRKQNITKDLKAKSAKNDLKGIWKTIKMASNLPANTKDCYINQLDENDLNKYFTVVGSDIQATIMSNDKDNML